MKFIDIGKGNLIPKSRIIAIVSFDAAPIKRLVQESRDQGVVIDATCGHKCQSVLIMDSKHIILSYRKSDEIISIEDNISDENGAVSEK
jgi:regulator of extracellular matrix RemA (YlzA/DUF370 family)